MVRRDDWLDEPPPDRGDVRRAFRKGLLMGLGGTLLGLTILVVIGLAVVGVLSESGHVPPIHAVRGDELKDSVIELLVELDVIEPDERVLYYYSSGVLDYKEDGNLFTDRRVVSYWTERGEFVLHDAQYADIATITPTFDDGFLADSTVRIDCDDGSWFELIVSNEKDRDEEFVELLQETWRRER